MPTKLSRLGLLGVFALLLASLGCGKVRPCREGTVFVTVAFDAATAPADEVLVQITVGSAAPVEQRLAHVPGESSSTLEIAFPSGYPQGSEVTVHAVARAAGAELGAATAKVLLAGGCEALELRFGAPPPGSDGGASLANGSACSSDDACGSGHCVDGLCCNTACTDQCAACDNSGSEGTCTPATGAPRGARPACTGDGTVCGGACDGSDPTACVYPEVECRAQGCTGNVKTLAATCSMGSCPAETTEACPVTCGASDCITVTDVAAGFQATCALMSDKTVRCFGYNRSGQLGLGAGDMNDHDQPVTVPGLSNVKELSAGPVHMCALLEDGTARCWGGNSYGELGTGTKDNNAHPAPEVVMDSTGLAPLAAIKHIKAGWLRTCASVGNYAGYCWGYNGSGQLGDGTKVDKVLPSRVCASGSAGTCVGLGNVFELALGASHTCARVLSGSLACWGSNFRGQLGLWSGVAYVTDNLDHLNPSFVKNPANTAANLAVEHVAAGNGETGDTTCATDTANKNVMCWGSNGKGALGRDAGFANPVVDQGKPVAVGTMVGNAGPFGGVSTLSGGYYHFCAYGSAMLRCWGGGGYGQLGDLSTADQDYAATTASVPAGVAILSSGDFHSCAVLVDGRLYCWGWNSSGEIGRPVGTMSDVTSPMPVIW